MAAQTDAAATAAGGISVARCREILGPDCRLSDAEVETLAEQVLAVAKVIVRDFAAARVSDERFRDACKLVPKDDHYEVEERAAIIEFEGALSRDESNRAGLSAWLDNHEETKD